MSDVLESSLFEEFEDLSVPLVVLEGMDGVRLGFNEIREHTVGERHCRDGHGTTPLRFHHVEASFGQHRSFAAVGVHVGGHDDGRNALVGVEQRQGHDRAHIDGEPLVVHAPALKTALVVGFVPCVGEVSIDVEGVVYGAQIVEIVVHHHPFRVGVGLDLMADDARPGRRVNDDEVGIHVLNGLCRLIVGVAKTLPTRVLVGCQNGVGMNGHHERGDHFAVGHALTSSWA